MSQAEVDAANKLIIDSITKYKVIVAGCRDFADCELLKEKCDFYLQNKKPENIVIVSSHASGADALGERYAQERGYETEIYPADWKAVGQPDRFGTLRWLLLQMPSSPSGMAKAGAQRT